MPSTRVTTRPYLPALRQWGRVTVTGVLKHKRKPTVFASALTAWIVILVLLYTLRLFAKQSTNQTSVPSFLHNDIDSKIHEDPTFWEQRHLIFCISPGLAGSAHLAHVLDFAYNTRVFHQPIPSMANKVLQAVLLDGQRDSTFEFRAAQKLGAIKHELKDTSKQVVYAETSHMFITTFADVVLKTLGDLSNISVIVLRQPIQNTIHTQLTNGWFSPGHHDDRVWYYDVADVHPSERVAPSNFSVSDILDRAIAYNLDIWIRAQRLRQSVQLMQGRGRWANVRVYDVALDSIMSPDGVQTLLSSLGLQSNQNQLNLLSFHIESEADDDESNLNGVAAERGRDGNPVHAGLHQGEITPEKILQRMEELAPNFPVLNKINDFSAHPL